MPSIRRSLIAYFLVLMGLTLLGMGLLVHQVVQNALSAREAAEQRRVKQEYDVRCRDTIAKFDDELYIHGTNLVRELRKEYGNAINQNGDAWPRIRLQMTTSPIGHALSPWSCLTGSIVMTYDQRFRSTVYWRTFPAAVTEELVRRSFDEGDHPGWWQIDLPRTPLGRPSPIVPAGQSVLYALNTDELDNDLKPSDDYHKFDDIQVPGEGAFRRVLIRYPLLLRLSNSSARNRPRETSSRNPPPPITPTPPMPGLYVQYARKQTDLDSLLLAHADKLERDLSDIRQETATESRRVLFLLLALGAVAVLPLPTGGLWLVHRGLRPLRNLTDAVSQVSERDFRLPVQRHQLSAELLPIHERLSDTLEALKRAFEREKQAVGDISHELRTPLAALRTNLDVALRKPRDAESYRNTLTECRDITKQLSKLVDRILMLASLDAGESAPSRLPMDLSEMAQEVLAVLRPLAEEQHLTLTAEVPSPLRVTTDPDKLREVVVNLLHNAIEYNRPGGQVALVVRKQGLQVVLEVKDTGIGMTPEVQAKIFERFYRADSSRHAVGVHAGLGLAIVKEYVDRLHGTVTVESQPGVGSTFTVTIPCVI